jgi:hypothetical protein
MDPSELNLHPSVLNLRLESDEDEPSSDLNEDTPSDLDGDEPSCNECDPVLVANLNKVKVNDDHHETTQINEMSRCLANIAKLEVDHDMNLAFLTHFIRKQDNVMLFANGGTSEDGRLQTCEVGVVNVVVCKQ